MRELKHLIYRRDELDRKLRQSGPQRGQDFSLERISLGALNHFPEARRVTLVLKVAGR